MGVNTISLLSAASDPDSASAEACRRIADFFRPYPAKELARMFNISPKTAQTWRQGQWPIARHQHAIVQRFGRAWLDWVYGPLLPAEDRALSAQLTEIEGRLAAVRVTIQEIESQSEGAEHGAVAGTAAPTGALAAPAGAARGEVADGRGGTARATGAGLAGVGARAGALALAVMMIAGSLPDQVQVPRLQRGGPARVVRVLRGPEVL